MAQSLNNIKAISSVQLSILLSHGLKFMLCLLAILAISSTLFAQEEEDIKQDNYQLIKTIPVEVALLSTDKLQNVFVVNKKGEVIKYNPTGEELARFNEFALGMPGHIDATNPFQILLFYPDQGTVVLLNNTLNKIAEYDLLEFDFITTLCFSNNGKIWLYDPAAFQLKKVDRNGRILLTSQELSLVLEDGLNPNFMLERNNQLFVNDSTLGVLIFDVYGQFIRTLPLLSLESFQVLGNQLLYFKKGILNSLNLQSLTNQEIRLPQAVKETDFVRVENGRLFIGTDKKLWVYSFK